MIEIVHDCAPGAVVGFCGPEDDLEMIDCAACLQQAFGAQVVVDDLAFPSEPFFADGAVTEAVQDAVRAGVAWFSAAGNEAQQHYQGLYQACRGSNRNDFIGSVDCTLKFAFAGDLQIVLQWNDPLGASANNYDMCVPGLGCSEDPQNGTQDPFEAMVISCGGEICTAGLEIFKRSGAAKELEVYFEPLSGGVELLSSRILGDSIFGHPCAEGVFAVGAIDAADSTHNSIERFSSRGPCTIQFPKRVQRPKPDLAGIDGISNTGPGGFPSPFFGTSAAAPSVAAVAALLLDYDRGLTLEGLRQALRTTAVDLGNPGIDAQFGYGRVDAAAAGAVLPTRQLPTPTATATPTPGPCVGDCNGDGRITVDELVRGVNIALGNAGAGDCHGLDRQGQGRVAIDDLVAAVAGALRGCVAE